VYPNIPQFKIIITVAKHLKTGNEVNISNSRPTRLYYKHICTSSVFVWRFQVNTICILLQIF